MASHGEVLCVRVALDLMVRTAVRRSFSLAAPGGALDGWPAVLQTQGDGTETPSLY